MTTETAKVDSEAKTETTQSSEQAKFVKIDVAPGKSVEVSDATKTHVVELRDQFKTVAKQLQETQARLKTFEDAESKQKSESEQKKLEQGITTPEVEKLTKHFEQREAQKLAQIQADAEAKISKYKNSSIRDKVEAIIARQEDLVPSARMDVLAMVLAEGNIDLEDNEAVVFSDGKPKRNDDGTLQTVDAKVKKLIADRDYLKIHKGVKGTTKDVKVDGRASQSELEAMPSTKRIELMKRGLLDPKLVTALKTKAK